MAYNFSLLKMTVLHHVFFSINKYYIHSPQALQLKMASLLAHQVAKGGVVGAGDDGPPPLTITTAADNEDNVSTLRFT